MPSDREIFRKNLVNLMNSTRVKQVDIAKYAQVSYQTVSAWVTGRGYPRAESMQRLCQFFGIRQSALTEEQTETDETRLITAFRALPVDGRAKLLERADELLQLYKKGRKAHEEK
ncbi:MAG: helix-turn-helix transcriptional regulator [Treponema sp.]|nr:helix-turn-helix transcriptional regulator [Treponema sp.]